MHQFQIRLFAAAKQAAKADSAEVTLAPPYTVADLRDQLARQFPQIAALIAQSRIAVNASYAAPESVLTNSDEIALIPPVSGG
jgi:molybdopterin converting factor subunit 1